MGATTFMTKARGKSPAAAFNEAVERALYLHGHAGYTGTIAEKYEFTVITPPPDGTTAEQYARDLLDEGDPRIDDKWGPAGCIKIDADTYLFFGWASS